MHGNTVYVARAAKLCSSEVNMGTAKPSEGVSGVALRRDERGLALAGDGMELRGDFSRMLPRLKPGRLQKELLVRAARTKGVAAPAAADCTAGLGEDSLLLAAAGFEVTLFERDETIAALLADALERAAADPQLASIVSRMHLVPGDSIEGLSAIDFTPDVVYLDPMFPARTKSAAVKKKFQLLHHLEQPCEEEEALVNAALAIHPSKVIIKRPAKGPQLAGIKPAYSICGKAVRYDVLVPSPA
ncbi:class I SAM-dependent methyltransferase [Paratractidigestivibacter sp.]|uniref:class I SAM-dependent methyltransferase n=1 Tax=Paratractidigestivibacter sp. TaxID=2847316 RepID=UPI002ABD6A9E|nr:class I SAM-dependent methyltransferase [Paratractidigestivibacter sp.]